MRLLKMNTQIKINVVYSVRNFLHLSTGTLLTLVSTI